MNGRTIIPHSPDALEILDEVHEICRVAKRRVDSSTEYDPMVPLALSYMTWYLIQHVKPLEP